MFLDSAKRVCLFFGFSEKSLTPKGFISCLHFHTRVAITEAVASFKQRSPDLASITSERILSESLVLVMVRAAYLIALLISSVIVIEFLSSGILLYVQG